MMMVMIILKTLVLTYLVQIICPGITLTITPIKKIHKFGLILTTPFLVALCSWFMLVSGPGRCPFSWRMFFGERLVL